MSRIAILSDTLASQVAAGEVVERPSSVLKELVENCLDAQATRIEIEVRKGGAALMKVSDNGHGMDKENALLSLERHATSKLSSSEGLSSITTHGFRGEALPSIASVARFKLTTNDDQHHIATDIVVEGGKVISVNEAARAQGTTIEIKDLFYNVPARRKFLKSEATEFAHIEHALKLSALGNNHVRYVFTHNGRLIWDLKPTTDRRLRITELIGTAHAEQLIEVPSFQFNHISLSGYLLPGKQSRGSSRSQTVFINKRPVDDPVIKSALKDGYLGHIKPGQFPVVWLWIDMPPQDLDVNVHPAKKEVRFTRPSEIKHVITEAIASALSPKPRPAISPPRFIQAKVDNDLSPPKFEQLPSLKKNVSHDEKQAPTPSSITPPHPPNKEEFLLTGQWATPDQDELNLTEDKPTTVHHSTPNTTFLFIGYFKTRYWLLEDDNGLVILDPKAAHNRITYEALKKAYQDQSLLSQPLLIPLLIELSGHDQVVLSSHLTTFNDLGVEINHFGGNSFQILSLPTIIKLTDPELARVFILSVIDALEGAPKMKSEQAKEKALENILRALAEKAAQQSSFKQVYSAQFISALMTCDIPYCTPSGSPTMIHYAESEFKKKLS